jgi:hypothetical protein
VGKEKFGWEVILFGQEAITVLEFLLLKCRRMEREESVSVPSREATNFVISL